MPRKQGACSSCGGSTSTTKARICISCRKDERTRLIPKAEYARRWNMKRKYGLSDEEFGLLWQAFSGKCGICLCNLSMPSRKRGQPRNAAVIDHNHNTGNLRGLLCNSCNKALGLFNDSVLLLRNATKWLENANEKTCNNPRNQ